MEGFEGREENEREREKEGQREGGRDNLYISTVRQCQTCMLVFTNY